MAIVRVQVSTSLVGKEAEFMKSVADGAALMQKKVLRNAVRVALYTNSPERAPDQILQAKRRQAETLGIVDVDVYNLPTTPSTR